MWSTNSGSSEPKTKTNFPLGKAVDNVVLFKCEPNDKIPGVSFTFLRREGDTISFLTDTILPPKKEWCSGGKQLPDGTIQTAQQEYDQKVKQFSGYITYLATGSGIPKEATANIKAESFDDFVKVFCEAVNTNKTDDLLYLKTVKDKDGYTKLPRFKGKGVVSLMDDGHPVFEYTSYEQDLIDKFKQEGVEADLDDDTTETQTVEPVTSSIDTSSFDDV